MVNPHPFQSCVPDYEEVSLRVAVCTLSTLKGTLQEWNVEVSKGSTKRGVGWGQVERGSCKKKVLRGTLCGALGSKESPACDSVTLQGRLGAIF